MGTRLGIALLLTAGVGCFSPLMQVPGRTAIEQQLASAALAHCVAKLDLGALDPGRAYALEVAAPDGSDVALIRARIERHLAGAGLRVDATDDDAPVLLAAVPFVGVDVEATLLGFPFIVPGLPVALGDISLYRSNRMIGRARVELSLREAGVLRPVASAEGSRHYRNLTFLIFVGPFRATDLDEGPMPGDEERAEGGSL